MYVLLESGSIGEVSDVLRSGSVVIVLDDGSKENGEVEEVLDETRIDKSNLAAHAVLAGPCPWGSKDNSH